MWCRHCQQDVPAVAQTSRSNASCSRCRRELRSSPDGAVLAAPDDSGIAIDAVHVAKSRTVAESLECDPEERERRLRRGLRPVYRLDLGLKTADSPAAAVQGPPPVVQPAPGKRRNDPRRAALRSPRAAALSLLIALGVAVLCVGVACLAWAAANGRELLWHWGMTTTISGEAALILGLTLMAIRLWRNSRRVSAQLDGVDQQLSEIQYAATRLAHARQSCSQAYYDHFGAAASPPIALANLRGQLDEISARLRR